MAESEPGAPSKQISRLERAKERVRKAASSRPSIMPPDFDKDNAFLIFASTRGDYEKTAKACNVDPFKLQMLGADENWETRIKGMKDLQESTNPRDIERGINRAINLVQAHRIRMLCERIIDKMMKMDDAELLASCISEDPKTGCIKFTTRPFADLTSAMEKAHLMTYYALSDTTPDRGRRRKEDEDKGPAYHEIHAAIASQMAEVGKLNSPRSELFKLELAQAEDARIKAELQQDLTEDTK